MRPMSDDLPLKANGLGKRFPDVAAAGPMISEGPDADPVPRAGKPARRLTNCLNPT